MITVFFDGACEFWCGKRNPGGLATYGWLIHDGKQVIAKGYGEVGRGQGMTNNIAEYTALIRAMEAYSVLKLPNYPLIQGDSQLVIKQVSGEWQVKSEGLMPLVEKASKLVMGCKLQWIPREQNQAADDLSKLAYGLAKRGDGQPWDKRFRVTANYINR